MRMFFSTLLFVCSWSLCISCTEGQDNKNTLISTKKEREYSLIQGKWLLTSVSKNAQQLTFHGIGKHEWHIDGCSIYDEYHGFSTFSILHDGSNHKPVLLKRISTESQPCYFFYEFEVSPSKLVVTRCGNPANKNGSVVLEDALTLTFFHKNSSSLTKALLLLPPTAIRTK